MLTMEVCRNSSGLQGDNTTLARDEEDEYLRELAQLVKHYVMGRGIPIISSLGLVGNFLSLLVLTSEKLHKVLTKMEISAHIGMIALAVSDLLLCLLVLLVTTLPMKEMYGPGEVLLYFHLTSSGLITVFIITSTWLIVVMAAERYVAVCHPLRARNFILLWRTRAYVIVLFVLCPLCTIPIFLEQFIQKVVCVDGQVLYHVASVSRDSKALRRIIWALVFDFVPCGALIYFNTCLIWKIHKAKQLRERLAPHQSTKRRSQKPEGIRTYRWDSEKRSRDCVSSVPDGLNGKSGGKSLLARLSFSSKHKHQREARMLDLLEVSESMASSQSSHPSCNGGEAAERRGEKQLLCQQGKNGVVQTSPCTTPGNSNTHRRSQGTKDRTLSAKRRYSDNALHSVTATLVAIVLTFLILVSPWELLKFGMQYSSTPVDRHKMDIALYLTNLMQVLNFSFNFVLYCLVNKSFRKTLRNLICLQSLRHEIR